MTIAFDTPELLLGRDDAESSPSANHGRVLPALDVSRDSTDGSVEILDGVGGGKGLAKQLGQSELHNREGLFHPFAKASGSFVRARLGSFRKMCLFARTKRRETA